MPTFKFKLRRSKDKGKEVKSESVSEADDSLGSTSNVAKMVKSLKSPNPKSISLQPRRYSHTGVVQSLKAATDTNDKQTSPAVRKSSSCSGLTGVEGSRERRLSDIAQLDTYIKYMRKNADDDSLPCLPNRLCCAQVLRQVLMQQERQYVSDLLHGKLAGRRTSLPATTTSERSSAAAVATTTTTRRQSLQVNTTTTSNWSSTIDRKRSQVDAFTPNFQRKLLLGRHSQSLCHVPQQHKARYLQRPKETNRDYRARVFSSNTSLLGSNLPDVIAEDCSNDAREDSYSKVRPAALPMARESGQLSCGEESHEEEEAHNHTFQDDDYYGDSDRAENWMNNCRQESSSGRQHSNALYLQNLEIY
ncbi:uncharacterized protein LOC101858784 [Aplysia californica]|uniref:Uncharacterized protein LOC101858784 n=1 Tax=Aplysia californica TaxID=6500 RepID=A0ABM0JRA0_APLCA|nr:uncharacterized protein LOC101858784 [Aplysia californica]